MMAFAHLLDRLVLTQGRNDKLALLRGYFESTPDPARGYALAAIAGELDLPSVKPAQLRERLVERVDPVLFAMSYDFVGDLAETMSLLWPESSGANRAPPLDEIVETLRAASRKDGPRIAESFLDALDQTGRWALIKLMTGGLRVGVSTRLAKQALADFGGKPVNEIEEIWHGLTPPYGDLFAWLEGKEPKPAPDDAILFRPVMLAHPLVSKKDRDTSDAIDPDEITPEDFAFEWKWDGVRVQAASRGKERRIYTRTGDDISRAFPDVADALGFDGVIDGELLVRTREGGVAPFNALQKRLNRKTVSPSLINAHPAFIRAYDLLVDNVEDIRERPYRERRARLEQLVAGLMSHRVDLSPQIAADSVAALDALRSHPPAPEIEGVMLKRWESPYLAGRPRGHWYKWKRDPYLVDAVLMYAQRGHGRRSGSFSDFTFGLWRTADSGWELTPVGKAYFGFTDAELKTLNRFIASHARERFGPVTSVTATRETGLVLEIAFEGVQRSTRHKSGVAMRFPRINRIRWDKPPAEAESLSSLEALIAD